MKLDINVLIEFPLIVLGVMFSFMALKVLIIRFLAVKAGELSKDGWASGFMLAQMGEFGFVLIALATQVELLPMNVASILLGVGVISMAITPFMVDNASKWALKLSNDKGVDTTELETLPDNSTLADHVVICGFGRVGQTVSRFLKQEDINFVAIDIDPLRVTKARAAGENVLFGSSRQTELLHAAHLSKAKLVVIAFGEDKQSLDVIEKVRTLSKDVPILVRTRNDDQLQVLKDAGADEVVPEILEGSLMLVSQVLSLTGVPLSRIFKRVQKERNSHYSHLHGFFQGEHTDMSPEAIERIEFAHAVHLNDDSYAVGHSIAELKQGNTHMIIVALKRGDVETEYPEDNTILQDQDTLIVRGKPRRVELTERFLQEGT
jgi:CPA2 family monovalent cation:H+ antiporter-2